MADMSKIVNGINAIAVTVNELSKSHIALADSVNNISKVVLGRSSLDVVRSSHIDAINVSKYSNDAIDSIHRKVIDKVNGVKRNDVQYSELEAVSELSDRLLSVVSDLKLSASDSANIAGSLSVLDENISNINNKLDVASQYIRDKCACIDCIMDDVSELSKKYSGIMSCVNESMFHMEQCFDSVSDIDMSVVDNIPKLAKLIADFEGRVSDADSSTLLKTQRLSNDIISAVDEIRSYMKPMADRLSAVERKISNIGSSGVSVPELNGETLRAGRRRA